VEEKLVPGVFILERPLPKSVKLFPVKVFLGRMLLKEGGGKKEEKNTLKVAQRGSDMRKWGVLEGGEKRG